MFLLHGALIALAADPTPPPKPCDTPAHHAFDFWVGEWDVSRPDGQAAGKNHIRAVHGGCALHEQFSSASGTFTGESLTAFDAKRDVWHQTWVDSSGTVLLLEGGLVDGSMVLEGPGVGTKGPYRQKITWTPLPNGHVRQHWQVKPADADWATVFDGTYQPASPPSPQVSP